MEDSISLRGEIIHECRYGENPHQKPSGLYTTSTDDPLGLDKFQVLEGSPGYVNWTDIDRGLVVMTTIVANLAKGGFNPPEGSGAAIAIGLKHGNACGASFGNFNDEVMNQMLSGDPRAIFGGVVMFNFEINGQLAKTLLHHDLPSGAKRRILDVVVAPSITDEAMALLVRKKNRCKIVVNRALAKLRTSDRYDGVEIRPVRGGFLIQPASQFVVDFDKTEMHCSLSDVPDVDELLALILAASVGSTSNSNTITITMPNNNGPYLIGNGVGQHDRVGAAELAVKRARDMDHDITGGVAYSDSFFPFPDAPEVLIDAGIEIILSMSGSQNDQATIDLCEKKGIALLLVPNVLGRGFCRH